MSIVTKSGDKGMTALMYGRKVSKCHPRVEACGTVDELNAALGIARATAKQESVSDPLVLIQKDLVILMGELAVYSEDRERYVKDGYSLVMPEMVSRLDGFVGEIETSGVSCHGWATPGAGLCSAALDLARTACRRAERRVCALRESGDLQNPEVLVYLNRLADLLWLLARREENRGRE